MKKGMAMEGFILPDGTVKPSYKYDDTKVKADIQTNKDDIDNLKSRVKYLEEHGGAEDPTKADKVSEATEDNLAALDVEGNLIDSGYDASDFAPVVHGHAISDITGLYDALAGKMNKILTLRIDVNTSDDDYPMVTEAGSLLSAFVNNVSVGTYVPVLVELHTQSATVGTILGTAKWTLEGQEDEQDVEIRIGKLLFSTYRQEVGQQWGGFTDWTKSSSQDIDNYFL